MASSALRVGDPGIVAAQGMGADEAAERLDPVPEGVGDRPSIVADGWRSGIRVGPDLGHKSTSGARSAPESSTLIYLDSSKSMVVSKDRSFCGFRRKVCRRSRSAGMYRTNPVIRTHPTRSRRDRPCPPPKLGSSPTGPTASRAPDPSPRGQGTLPTQRLKHGLSGEGVVLPEGDAGDVEPTARRPSGRSWTRQSSIGQILVGQLATLSVRMERGGPPRSPPPWPHRVRHAATTSTGPLRPADRLLDFDRRRPPRPPPQALEVARGGGPLILAWRSSGRPDRETRPLWTASHRERAENLTGYRIDEAKGSRIKVLSEAVWGDFGALGDDEGGELDDDDRRVWARGRLVEADRRGSRRLEADRESLDFEAIELDRLGAGRSSPVRPVEGGEPGASLRV